MLSGGTSLSDPVACRTCVWKLHGETQEERLQYFDQRRSDVDDDGANCDTTSTRVVHSLSSSGTI